MLKPEPVLFPAWPVKTAQFLLFTVFGLHCALAADSGSPEDFRKMDGVRQREAIKNAPPEEKETLKRIYFHGQIVIRFGGEKGALEAKKSSIAMGRAHFHVMRIFEAEGELWQNYILQTGLALLKKGVSQKKIDETLAEAVLVQRKCPFSAGELSYLGG